MIRIGILPTYNENKDRPFLDTFSFVNNYAYRLFINGALPVGILFPNGKFNEKVIEDLDGFLIPGGSVIRLYHILTIHYAMVHNKPFLGVCMGMQALGIYNNIVHELLLNDMAVNYDNISLFFNMFGEEKYLKLVSNHNVETIFYTNSIGKSSHIVYFCPNTLLCDIYNTDSIMAPSIHNFALKEVFDDFTIIAESPDGYIEGIYYNNLNFFILGVQFHIEMEDKHNNLFKRFILECEIRKC